MSDYWLVMTDPVLEAIDSSHVAACVQDVLIVMWADAISGASIDGLAAGLRTATARCREGVCVLGVHLPTAPMVLTRAARERLSHVLADYRDDLRGIAITTDGDNLTRWLRQGLMSSITMSSFGADLQGFPSRDAASRFIASRSAHDEVTAKGLTAAVAQLESRLRQCRNPSAARPNRTTVMLG